MSLNAALVCLSLCLRNAAAGADLSHDGRQHGLQPDHGSNPKSRCFLVPTETLDFKRFGLKLAQVVLSFVAFLLEELVNTCLSCGPLYYFEFMSCSAFLFTLLLLVLLSTPLHQRVGVSRWSHLDLYYTAVVFILFLIASIVFSADNQGSSLEKGAAGLCGCLACLFFLLDLVYIFKTQGFPWKSTQNQENQPNGPTSPP
ncbi:hypothetical protein WMY93_034238 [Mugilogobius chulae]|uniref:MARVEL domain-containing protein n=1 Tax=Mugilogobius chulae TaxID=88201 RepID=A0AAW0MF06_9GOBI